MSDTISETASGAGAALTKKLGPFPGWVWVVLVVGLAYGVYWWRKRNTPVVADTAAPGDATYLGADASSLNLPPSTSGNYTGPTTPNGVPAVTTNAQWARMVTNQLIAQNQYGVTDINNAVSNYLNGIKLTAAQQAIINAALSQYGVPPEGVIPIVEPDPTPAPKPTPAPTPAPAPKPARTYTVQRGDSLSSIAQRFYGTPDWQKIYNDPWNHSIIRNPNLIYAGQVFGIPY